MADISKSTTRTSRGEGHAATQSQIATGSATRKKGPSRQTRTETMPTIISTGEETPGKVISVTTDRVDGKSSTQTRPTVTSRKTEAAAEVRSVTAPVTTERIEHEDHGIKVVLKCKINSFR